MLERLESIMAGLSLLKLHYKRIDASHLLQVVEQCVLAGMMSVEEDRSKLPDS